MNKKMFEMNYDLDDPSGEEDSFEDERILEIEWVKDWDDEEKNQKFLEEIRNEIEVYKAIKQAK